MAKTKAYMRAYRAKGGGGGAAKSSSMTPEQAMQATNPNYRLGPKWQKNCQRCVIAYEMNRRGITCEAKPRILRGKDDVANNWYRLMEGQTWESVGSRSKATTVSNIENALSGYGEGSRAVVFVTWKGGRSAHVFNAEWSNGTALFVDAQTGRKVDIDEYIGQSMPTRTRISRVDNLQPNQRFIDGCIERR